MALYLVTGGAGFIGSHLCEALRAKWHRVRVLDDLSSGHRENLPDDVELMVGDIADPHIVNRAIEGIAGCFHLAAIVSVSRSLTEWAHTHRTNLTGTVTLLEALARHPKVPMVYASSAAVYGDADPPITEDAPKRPRSAYGADKYGCELHATVASHSFGNPTVGLRFFNVYGPRQDPTSTYSGVISIFLRQLSRGEPIDIFGDGNQTRDFIYVGDVVNALMAAIDKDGASVFNVCTGTATSIRSLADHIATLCQRGADIRFHPARPGDVLHSCGSPKRLREAFDLPKPVSLATGLERTWEWYARTLT